MQRRGLLFWQDVGVRRGRDQDHVAQRSDSVRMRVRVGVHKRGDEDRGDNVRNEEETSCLALRVYEYNIDRTLLYLYDELDAE